MSQWIYIDENGHTWKETKGSDGTVIECDGEGYIHYGPDGVEINGEWDNAFAVSKETFAKLMARILPR